MLQSPPLAYANGGVEPGMTRNAISSNNAVEHGVIVNAFSAVQPVAPMVKYPTVAALEASIEKSGLFSYFPRISSQNRRGSEGIHIIEQ